MSKLAVIKPHLTVSELQEGFRTCTNVIEKTPWQVILLRMQGRSTAEIAGSMRCNG